MASTRPKPDYWLSTDGLIRIRGWIRDGCTNEQIAANIGISKTTFYRWCNLKPHPEETDLPYRQIGAFETLGEFITHACTTDDEEVIESVRKSASGYWIEETYHDRKGNPKKVRRWIAPDSKAQALWLKNRKPNDWNRENEKQVDTSAIERLDAILSSLTIGAQQEDEQAEQVDEVILNDSTINSTQ